jgi:hypothetical protein
MKPDSCGFSNALQRPAAIRSRHVAVSGALAILFTLLVVRLEPTRLLHKADSSELRYGLLKFIRFKFTTDLPISSSGRCYLLFIF